MTNEWANDFANIEDPSRSGPPDPLAWTCEECGTPIDGKGWCRPCARRIVREQNRD